MSAALAGVMAQVIPVLILVQTTTRTGGFKYVPTRRRFDRISMTVAAAMSVIAEVLCLVGIDTAGLNVYLSVLVWTAVGVLLFDLLVDLIAGIWIPDDQVEHTFWK